MTENGRANSNKKKGSLKLSPPEFSLDNDSSSYELWTFRLPVSIPLADLDKVELDVSGDGYCGTFESKEKKYKIQLGDSVENESFRVLVPDQLHQGSGVDESDDDDAAHERIHSNKKTSEGHLLPSSTPFSRHLNVSVATKEMNETALAPRIENSPTPEDKVRHAYAPVAQRAGLKRRWMPLGSSSKAIESSNSTSTRSVDIRRQSRTGDERPTNNRKLLSSNTSTAVQEDEGRDAKKLRKEEKKAKKKERKSSKN